MTFLYLTVRYVGILWAIVGIFANVQTISGTDVGCLIMFIATTWIIFVVNLILGIIMIARLNAMYQRSRTVLIILVAIFVAVYVPVGLITVITTKQTSGEELILSGTHQCTHDRRGGPFLLEITWVVGNTVWEVVALCFAVWIAVKHFRELRQYSTGGIVGDCLAVLMKTHVFYFSSFVAVTCFQLSYLSHRIAPGPYSLKYMIYHAVAQNVLSVQLFVAGPRLVLGVREHHAKLRADSDMAAGMTSITIQGRVHVSTSSSV